MQGQALPSAPPAGYENVGFDPTWVQPPVTVLPPQPPTPQPPISDVATLSPEQIRAALRNYVSEHCCYGKQPAEELIITGTSISGCLHYTLETFGEKRQTHLECEPYRPGEYIDGPASGRTPGPWEIPVTPSAFFQNGSITTPVPHSAYVRPCNVCPASGYNVCKDCNGVGTKPCTKCEFSRSNGLETHCFDCNGTTYIQCGKCQGAGRLECNKCKGGGSLKYFVNLVVEWKSHMDDFITESCSRLPKEKVRDVAGEVAFQEQQPLVWPIAFFPDPALVEASRRLVEKHRSAFPDEKILQQRHKIEVVPIMDVSYQWKEDSGIFTVYGLQNKVYFPDYPIKCCGCCSII